jgi:hypothetical protein
MGAQWPLVKARLIALLPTLPGWSAVTVFNGPPVTADVPTDYVTVGWETDDQSGSYMQVQSPDGFRYVETGEVRNQLNCLAGDIDLDAVEARAFVLMDALESAVRADRRLGVLSPEGTVDLEVDLRPLQTSGGSAQALVFTLHYQTVT